MATRSTRPTGTESSEKGTGRTRGAMPDPTEAMANMHRTFVEPLKGMAEDMAERMQALPVAGAMLQSGRKDLETLMRANEKSYQGLQALVKRQTEMLKDSILEWQDTVHTMSPGEHTQNIAKLDAMGKAAFKRALTDIQELSELAARSQAEAFELVRQRIGENIDEVGKLLKPGRK